MRRKRRNSIVPPVREFADRGLKWVLEPENIRGLLVAFSAEVAEDIDFTRMRAIPTSFIPDDLAKQEADIIYRAPFQSEGQERQVLIYILIEHQSTPDETIQFRLLFYMIGLWQMQRREFRYKKIPINEWRFLPIIPVVFYTGEERWQGQPQLESLMDVPNKLKVHVPHFETLVLRLKQTPPEVLTQAGHPFGWLLRVIQKENAPTVELEQAVDEAMDHLAGLAEEDRDAWTKLIYFMYLVLVHRRTASEAQRIGGRITDRIVRQGLPEEAEMAKTWAEELIEQGVDRGRIEATQTMLLEVLSTKFGTLPEEVERRIRSIQDRSELTRLARQAVVVDTLQEVSLQPLAP